MHSVALDYWRKLLFCRRSATVSENLAFAGVLFLTQYISKSTLDAVGPEKQRHILQSSLASVFKTFIVNPNSEETCNPPELFNELIMHQVEADGLTMVKEAVTLGLSLEFAADVLRPIIENEGSSVVDDLVARQRSFRKPRADTSREFQETCRPCGRHALFYNNEHLYPSVKRGRSTSLFAEDVYPRGEYPSQDKRRLTI